MLGIEGSTTFSYDIAALPSFKILDAFKGFRDCEIISFILKIFEILARSVQDFGIQNPHAYPPAYFYC